METTISVLLGSTLLVSLINLIKDLLLWKANRKATLDDKKEDKTDKVTALESCVKDHTEVFTSVLGSIKDFESLYKKENTKQDTINKVIVTDLLRTRCSSILEKNNITFNERKELLS